MDQWKKTFVIKTHLEPVGHLQGQEALNMQWIKKQGAIQIIQKNI